MPWAAAPIPEQRIEAGSRGVEFLGEGRGEGANGGPFPHESPTLTSGRAVGGVEPRNSVPVFCPISRGDEEYLQRAAPPTGSAHRGRLVLLSGREQHLLRASEACLHA
jgi:hypothetical protein